MDVDCDHDQLRQEWPEEGYDLDEEEWIGLEGPPLGWDGITHAEEQAWGELPY